jgi:TonB family protein
MPITEVPTPPSRTPDPLFRRKRTTYEDLEPDELLHLIDRLEDERSRARLREGIYISLLAHVVFFLLWTFGPKYILHRPQVISPFQVLKDRQKELTYLDLPPDALKRLKPKHPQALSDRDRVAQSQHPTLDRKTLEQLQAMRRAGPPAPRPGVKAPQPEPQQAPPQPAPQQQAPPQQQAQTAPSQRPTPPTQPLQPQQQAQLEAPKPAPTPPNFNTNATAGDIIRQATRQAAQGEPGAQSGDYGANLAPHHQGLQAGVDILSDTMGVDFGPYLQRVIAATYRSWLPIIPESARPPLMKQGKVGIEFIIMPDGSVKGMKLRFPSGDVALDRAAWGGITGASPYPPLPKDFKGPYLALRFGFYYNIRDDQQQ